MLCKVNDREVHFGSFEFNESVMFALKAMSGDNENDIISYFYDLGIRLFNDSVGKKRIPRKCSRSVKTFYKETLLQVKFDVDSTHIRPYYAGDAAQPIWLTMSLSYPNGERTLKGKDIDNMFSEAGLGLNDEQVTVVNKPEEKLYKCLKKKQPKPSTSTP